MSQDAKFSAELHRLCGKLREGEITQAESKRLNEMLLGSRGARRFYRTFMALASAIEARTTLQDAIDHEADSDKNIEALIELLVQEQEAGVVPFPADRIVMGCGPHPTREQSFGWRKVADASGYLLGHAIKSGPAKWAAVAAVFLLAATLCFVLSMSNGNRPPMTVEEIVDDPPTVSQMPVVATLTAEHDARWQDGPALAVGDGLRVGQVLTLAQGVVEITTARGAKVILESPSTFEIINSENALLLHHGKLVGIVENESAKGFLVRTSHLEVVDIGTRFEVDATDRSATEVHILEGVVEVGTPVASGAPPTRQRFVAGQVVRSLPTGGLAVTVIETTRSVGADSPVRLPEVTSGPPAPGKRVRVTPPEWEGTGVYHTLYLPVDWQPNQTYPVIVEFAPNKYKNGTVDGTVDDSHLGFYQSGGRGFIWLTMPFPSSGNRQAKHATWWWGDLGQPIDAEGAERAAKYLHTNLIRTLDKYGGDPSAVFATGFSRGAIAVGYIGHWNEKVADLWLGYLPHSHLDGFKWTQDGNEKERFERISGRATFVTFGERDDAHASSSMGVEAMDTRGFPVEWHRLKGTVHSDEWLVDGSDPVASMNDPGVFNVRVRMREWISEVLETRPGTSSISGVVVDAEGRPIQGVRVQSGASHWAFTNERGEYVLKSLIDGNRPLVATHPRYTFDEKKVAIKGEDVEGQGFVAEP